MKIQRRTRLWTNGLRKKRRMKNKTIKILKREILEAKIPILTYLLICLLVSMLSIKVSILLLSFLIIISIVVIYGRYYQLENKKSKGDKNE